MDIVGSIVRSRMMSGIRSKNSRPELLIRKALYAKGFRYRIHSKLLPGKPDIVLSKYKAVIFVHGCFWHGHNCHLYRLPKSNTEFWAKKIARNKEIDSTSQAQLLINGWRVGVIWECAVKGKSRLNIENIIDTTEEWLNSSTLRLSIKGKPV